MGGWYRTLGLYQSKLLLYCLYIELLIFPLVHTTICSGIFCSCDVIMSSNTTTSLTFSYYCCCWWWHILTGVVGGRMRVCLINAACGTMWLLLFSKTTTSWWSCGRDYSSIVVMIMDDGGDDLIHLQYANMMVWYTIPIAISIAPWTILRDDRKRTYVLSLRWHKLSQLDYYIIKP